MRLDLTFLPKGAHYPRKLSRSSFSRFIASVSGGHSERETPDPVLNLVVEFFCVVGTDDLKTETYSLENELRNDLIQFIKSRDDDKPRIKIDIFNRQYYNPEDILIYKYKDTFLRILDPSQTIAAKAKYAFDRRLHTLTQQKHSKDISGFLKLDGMFFHNMATNPNIVNLHSNMIEHGSLIKISNNDLPY